MILHNIPPVYDENSKILILGSFPSVKSRETEFFYAHPQNRFWRVLSGVFGEDCGETAPEKKAFLLRNRVALWDVAACCEITGSADSSIKNVAPNDISPILEKADIQKIFVNGKTAEKYYRQLIFPKIHREAAALPSTSPANAAKSLNDLIAIWKEAIGPI